MEKPPIILFEDPGACCGCGVCACACPHQAITMERDATGFVFPAIDESACVRCGRCSDACVFQAEPCSGSIQEVYAAASAITDIRRSASGGVFAALAARTLASGGIVAGAALDFSEGKAVPHLVCIDDEADLDRLLGSKYVQCDCSADGCSIGFYVRVRKYLEEGRAVTFGGTPCQVAALRAFAKGCDDRLLLVDIVCHGVPNSRFFNDYLQCIAHRAGAQVVGYSFRDKAYGWSFTGGVAYEQRGERRKEPVYGFEDSYYRLFLEAATYRESCYACPYASPSRSGDISIGDFWGVRDLHPEYFEGSGAAFDDSIGVSSLIVNTPKGKRYLEKHASDFVLKPSTYQKASARNKQLVQPVVRPPEREAVLESYRSGGYDTVNAWFEARKAGAEKDRTK